jgi:hypothetical protein
MLGRARVQASSTSEAMGDVSPPNAKQSEQVLSSDVIELRSPSHPAVPDTPTAALREADENLTAESQRYPSGWSLYMLTLG